MCFPRLTRLSTSLMIFSFSAGAAVSLRLSKSAVSSTSADKLKTSINSSHFARAFASAKLRSIMQGAGERFA